MRFNGMIRAAGLTAVLIGCDKKPEVEAKAVPQGTAAAAKTASITGQEFAPSLSALSDTVWVRASRGDTAGLVRLMVDDSLFRDEIFPLSDAYDSARQDVFELVRGLDKVASVRGLKRLLSGASTPNSIKPAFPSYEVKRTSSGFILHSVPRSMKGGNRLFGSALCGSKGCQVGTFAGADLQADSPE